MKDVLFYVFFFILYSLFALRFGEFNLSSDAGSVVTWGALGRIILLFAFCATVARWTVLAFKRRGPKLLAGQEIVGVEEEAGEHIIDVVKPSLLRREVAKPKLKKKRPL
jgi:hypothetical protein